MARYGSIGEYIRERAADMGLNTNSLVDALNERYESQGVQFGISYISAIANEQFTPSQKRCHLIADFFGDDPNVILELAGYYEPPEETELIEAIAGAASMLGRPAQHMTVAWCQFLTDYFGPASKDDHGYLMLPNGDVIMLPVPPRVSTQMIQVAVSSALSKIAPSQP